MAQFTVFSAPTLNVFEFLSSPSNASTCVLFTNSLATEGLEYQILAPQNYSTCGEKIAEGVAWPVSLQGIVFTSTKLSSGFLLKAIEALKHATLAILPIRHTLGYQSIEFKLNTPVAMDELADLAQEFNLDINRIESLPTLRKPGLVVLDMDSTSIEIECIDEIAKLAGVGDEVSQITELAMQGQLDFSQSLRARVAKLRGIELALLDTIANDLPLMPGMRDLVSQFKSHGWKVAIASGGFTYFADNLKDLLGLDAAVSNTLAHENGVLTGEVVGEIVDAQVKARTVVALAKEYDIDLTQTIAIGDGANDLVMMEQAALGIAFHAKPLVQKQADVAIVNGDLGAVMALLDR